MTKQELIKSLETVPNDFEISVCTVNCMGMDCDSDITEVEINSELRTAYLILDEDELYSL